MGHRHRVRRLLWVVGSQQLVEGRRTFHRCVERVGPTRLVDQFGSCKTEVRCEALPFDGEQTVALQVAECAIVAKHVEAVRQTFERATRLVSSVGALTHVGADQCDSLHVTKRSHALQQL